MNRLRLCAIAIVTTSSSFGMLACEPVTGTIVIVKTIKVSLVAAGVAAKKNAAAAATKTKAALAANPSSIGKEVVKGAAVEVVAETAVRVVLGLLNERRMLSDSSVELESRPLVPTVVGIVPGSIADVIGISERDQLLAIDGKWLGVSPGKSSILPDVLMTAGAEMTIVYKSGTDVFAKTVRLRGDKSLGVKYDSAPVSIAES